MPSLIFLTLGWGGRIVLFYGPIALYACTYFNISYTVHWLPSKTVGYLKTGTVSNSSQKKKIPKHDLK